MKAYLFKTPVVGALLGLAIGLAFVITAHTSLDFLAGYLFYPAFPCYYVAVRLADFVPNAEWVAWTVGVLTMALIGAVLGLAVSAFRSLAPRHA